MRKIRKTVTRELYLLIIRMYDVEKLTTKGISERLDLSIKTVNRHITNFEAGTVFKPAAELYKETIERKTLFYTMKSSYYLIVLRGTMYKHNQN
ncbi:hypothetical protein GVAV_001037 [Gurleya vavrai]